MRYKTAKDLVFDFIKRSGGRVDKDELAKQVLKHFPDSAWNSSHWSFYKNQIDHGRYKDEFDKFVKGKIKLLMPEKSGGRRGPRAEDPKIKKIGDQILKQAREAITVAAGDDERLRFKINRWVFSRLHLDERNGKKKIKEAVWMASDKRCSKCGKEFKNIKGVELHRINGNDVYSIANCQLLCKPCHMSIS